MKGQMYIIIDYVDKRGRPRRKVRKANSFVRGFIDLLHLRMAQTAVTSGFVDTSGTTRTSALNANDLRVTAGAGDSSWGIIVGTGTNAVTISDYNLQTQCGEGTGSGQLAHGSVGTSAAIVSSGNTYSGIIISRAFLNASGSSINVKEVGMVMLTQTTPWRILAERTLVDFTIASGAVATVTYFWKVTA